MHAEGVSLFPLHHVSMAFLCDCGRCSLHIDTAKPAFKYWIKIRKMKNVRYVKNNVIIRCFIIATLAMRTGFRM